MPRQRSPSAPPRQEYGRRSPGQPRPPCTSLLVRNISRNSRPDDIREAFEEFGPLKDVYLPRDYHTKEPRGFGFVQYIDPRDASEAQYKMNRQIICGREISVVFAERNRKNPEEMRSIENSRGRSRRSRSPAAAAAFHGRSRSPNYCSNYSRSPSRRPCSPSRRGRRRREPSPHRRHYCSRSYSRSPRPGGRMYGREEEYRGNMNMRNYPAMMPAEGGWGMMSHHHFLPSPSPYYHHQHHHHPHHCHQSHHRYWGL